MSYILYLQVKGLVATGLLALVGIGIIGHGYDYSCAMPDKWSHFIGWLILGGLFIIPFVAVSVSVWLSRGHL